MIKAEGGAKNYKRDHRLPLAWRFLTVALVQERVTIVSKMKKIEVPLKKLDFINISQTEEVMHSRQEKSYGGELVTQIFMILGYLNFSFSVPP